MVAGWDMLGAAVADGASAHAVDVSPIQHCLLHAHGEVKEWCESCSYSTCIKPFEGHKKGAEQEVEQIMMIAIGRKLSGGDGRGFT